jgi:AAA domain
METDNSDKFNATVEELVKAMTRFKELRGSQYINQLERYIRETQDSEMLRNFAMVGFWDLILRQVAAKNDGVLSLEEILKVEFPKPEPLVEEFLNAGEVGLLIGRQKEGKSTLSLQLAIDIASGTPFLDRFVTRPGTILYVDYENRFYQLQQRGSRLIGERTGMMLKIKAYDSIADRDVGFANPERMTNQDRYTNLQKLVENVRPQLLIIDPLRLSLPGNLDITKDTDVVMLLDQIAQLQKLVPGMAVLLVHHVKKEQNSGSNAVRLITDPRAWIDKVYGSQALLGHVETIWGLEENDDGRYTLATVPRSHSVLILRLEKEPDSERCVLSEGGEPHFRTTDQSELWRKLPEEFSWKEAKEITKSGNTASRIIGQARQQGFLVQDPATKQFRKVFGIGSQWR